METLAKLFGSLLAPVYHCFDRIVILGHLPLLTRPENIVYFFRDIHQVNPISKEVLRQRTDDYHRWVEAFAKKHQIPVEWSEKGVRKEDYVRPHLRRMERRRVGIDGLKTPLPAASQTLPQPLFPGINGASRLPPVRLWTLISGLTSWTRSTSRFSTSGRAKSPWSSATSIAESPMSSCRSTSMPCPT